MAGNKPMLAGEGALWLQEGPNREPQYLGCHNIGGITVPRGDVTLYYCPDPSQPNKWKPVRQSQGAQGTVTTQIQADVTAMADLLEDIADSPNPWALFVHKVSKGKMNVFESYDRSFVLPNILVSSESLENLTARDPDSQERSGQMFDIAAEDLYRVFEMNGVSQSVTEAGAFNSIQYFDKLVGDRIIQNTYGFAAADADTGATANVKKTTDGGSTWTNTGADPFATNEHIAKVEVLDMGDGTYRLIAVRGSADGSNPAEIAYSDDDGDTWTNVNVGTINGQYALKAEAVFALDRYNIWIASIDGYIYKSEDAGATWTAQESGVATTSNLNAIHFSDENNGFAGGVDNAVLRTTDGGTTWSALTGPSGQSTDDVEVVWNFDENDCWLGFDDGNLYFTEDGGTTWTVRTHTYSNTGQVFSMAWMNEYIGLMVHNTDYAASPNGRLMFTINGGYNWEVVSMPTNSGFNFVQMLNNKLAYVAGEVQGSNGMIIKVTGG